MKIFLDFVFLRPHLSFFTTERPPRARGLPPVLLEGEGRNIPHTKYTADLLHRFLQTQEVLMLNFIKENECSYFPKYFLQNSRDLLILW